MSVTYPQHPLEKKKYALDWAGKWLGSATILSSDWIAPGLTVEGEAEAGGVSSAMISGAAEGETRPATNRVTASDGRVKDYTIQIQGEITPLATVNKDPDDTLVLTHHAGFYDAALTVVSSIWSVAAGLTLAGDSYTTAAGIAELTGGTAGETYRLTNTLTMSNGEKVVGVIDLFIKEG